MDVKPPRPARRARTLTTPDLVLLSLLAERPMHGYEANAELERRQVREWAGISRPQVYYSLEKLERLRLVRESESDTPQAGPDRRVFSTTPQGRAALADALDDEAWTAGTERPPFLTWMALSWQTKPGGFARQLQRRRKFLQRQLAAKRSTLRAVRREVGHPYHEAVWMLTLAIDHLRTELRWLRKVSREADRRGPAAHGSGRAAGAGKPGND
jgi:DNA-binding PadR family transcriptional regulator